MEEKADLDVFLVLESLSEQLGQQHQMVIMNPDEIAILYVLQNSLSEKLVDFLVCCPCTLVKGNLTRVIVEQGP